MNDLTSLKDYLIADEIQRIKLLTKDELVGELIEVRASKIETLSDEEILNPLSE